MKKKWILNVANCADMKTDYLVKLIGGMEEWIGVRIDLVENARSNYPSKIEYARIAVQKGA